MKTFADLKKELAQMPVPEPGYWQNIQNTVDAAVAILGITNGNPPFEREGEFSFAE